MLVVAALGLMVALAALDVAIGGTTLPVGLFIVGRCWLRRRGRRVRSSWSPAT